MKNEAQQYLLDLPYVDWHLISAIPNYLALEVIDLIDEGFHCQYKFNDDWTAFSKHTKYESGTKPGGNYTAKDSFGMPKREPNIKI